MTIYTIYYVLWLRGKKNFSCERFGDVCLFFFPFICLQFVQ